jgi:hypothetical protein
MSSIEISEDTQKCVLSDEANFGGFRHTTPNNGVLILTRDEWEDHLQRSGRYFKKFLWLGLIAGNIKVSNLLWRFSALHKSNPHVHISVAKKIGKVLA